MPPHSIRPHVKSRSGCVACKQRRVKCDESKPKCSSCQRREIDCVYLPTTKRRSRAQPAQDASEDDYDDAPEEEETPQSGYSAKSLLELRLMHQYDDCTVDFFAASLAWPPAVVDVMRKEVPALALEFPFLMDVLLSVAMLHIASTELWEQASLPIAVYRTQATRSFQSQLAQLTDANLRPVAIASVLLGLSSFAADRLTNHPGLWLQTLLVMPRGPRLFVNLGNTPIGTPSPYASPYSSPFESAQLQPVNHAGLIDADPVSMSLLPPDLDFLLHIHETEEDWQFRDDIGHAVIGIGRLFGALASPAFEQWVAFKTRVWPFHFITPNLAHLAQQEHPRALIILGYYLAFLNFLPRDWLVEGVARRDVEKIQRLIGPGWEPYISIPMRAVLLEDTLALKDFLLSQLPPQVVGRFSPL